MRTVQFISSAVALGSLAAAANAEIFFFEATIDGSQEPTPVITQAMGTMTGQYDDVLNEFSFSWNITGPLNGTPGAPGAHIHMAPAGTNGPIQFFMSNADWPLVGSATWTGLTQTHIDALFDHNLYVNFHTTAHPGGEVRGQITLVPAPAAAGLTGLAGLVLTRRRR